MRGIAVFVVVVVVDVVVVVVVVVGTTAAEVEVKHLACCMVNCQYLLKKFAAIVIEASVVVAAVMSFVCFAKGIFLSVAAVADTVGAKVRVSLVLSMARHQLKSDAG